MPKYAIYVTETVIHTHRLIVECESEDAAEDIADALWDKAKAGDFNHHDDVPQAAKEIATLLHFDEDYGIDSENIIVGEREVQEVDEQYRVLN